MEAAILYEIAIAVVGMVVNEQQQKSAENRAARETYLRSIYQSVKDAYGVTRSQLDKAIEQLGIKLEKLVDATRGSARLSKASQILREFQMEYPDRVSNMRSMQEVIDKGVSKLTQNEAKMASKVQARSGPSNLSVLNDIAPVTNEINTGLKKIDPSVNTSQIDTQLTDAKDTAKKQVQQEIASLYHQGFNDPGKIREAKELEKELAEEQRKETENV